MQAQGSGAITHISTGPARAPLPFLLHYTAAKAALATYSKGLVAELAPKGIRVNSITPGLIESPGSDPLRQHVADAAGLDPAMMVAGIPLGRAGTPGDIADAVTFLVSDHAAYITGVDLIVDGDLNPNVRQQSTKIRAPTGRRAMLLSYPATVPRRTAAIAQAVLVLHRAEANRSAG